MCARYGTSFDFNTPITESTTFTADWLDPATIGCPQLKIGEDNLWYVSYDDGKTWTSLGVKATGATGEKGDKGDKGPRVPPERRVGMAVTVSTVRTVWASYQRKSTPTAT